jgi:hypothetical protein
MAARTRDLFLNVRTEGAILPADLLQRIVEGDSDLGGLTPDSYHLPRGEKLTEAINRAWNRFLGVWTTFQGAVEKLPDADPGTSLTRERWLLPLFQEIGYGRLLTTRSLEISGKSYPISHGWNRTPIHLLGCRVKLDEPTLRVAGASRSSPHSLVQELLNRSDDHRWGFVSNGLLFRILRDNVSLTRQAYVEFDLEAMMLGENYSDFVLFWLICHQSRVEAENPADCWLEKWSQSSHERGVRALEQLRQGVENAITALGRGFLAYSSNRELRDRLRKGELNAQDYYRQILRLVYRLLFLFVAEDRDLLLMVGEEHAAARVRYLRYYSTSRLRRLAERRTGTRHTDLYVALRLIMQRLGSDSGCQELALPALGSFLFSEKAMPDIEACEIANHDLLDAVRALAVTEADRARRTVDYKNLGPEELGSVYESLLELHPRVNLDAPSFELGTASGSERKTSGSYYTPTSLIECLLDSALDPVLEEATQKPESEAAILRLKVVDPACGSGHFLIAAAHRIAKRLAVVRTGDEEPSPEALRRSLRHVIGHCIYGVDVNPMAVELCKVNLWLEALEPGKPLSFLEHRIQCGNSLLGTTPALLAKGIPDEAFTTIEGDEKELCQKFKKVNKAEHKATEQTKFDFGSYPWEQLGNLAAGMMNLDRLPDDTIDSIHEKERLYEETVRSGGYLFGKFWADAWCAAFVWKKARQFPFPITEEIFRRIQKNPHDVEPWMRDEIVRLAQEYCFFHWHLAFPDVFRVPKQGEEPENSETGWSGGFDVVLGNPPWEHTELKEKEWFTERQPEIAKARNAFGRKKLIESLRESDPVLFRQFSEAVRERDAVSNFLANSGCFPRCGRGRINLYAVFAELMRARVNARGRMGAVLPTGIATDDTTKLFFQDVVDSKSLVSLFDFENRRGLFPDIDSRMKFCLFTSGRGVRPTAEAAEFVFFAHAVEDLSDPQRRFTLSPKEIALLNPNTRTCPIFRCCADAELTKAIYQHVPVLLRESGNEGNPWGVWISRMLNGSDDAYLFRDPKTNPTAMTVYESKFFWQFDHRYASVIGTEVEYCSNEEKSAPEFIIEPQYRVIERELPEKFTVKIESYSLAYRVITNATNERTVVATILPRCALINSANNIHNIRGAQAGMLMANLNAIILDFVCRQSMGGANLHSYVLQQLAVLPPSRYTQSYLWGDGMQTLREWLLPRVLELAYTAWDLEAFAQDCGWLGPPFRWNEERRFLLRCELDAAFFHLYLGLEAEWCQQSEALINSFSTPRHAVDYIMDTFPIVRRKDEQQFGEYRTKRLVLEIYDAMAEAARNGVPYQTRLDPPPADPRVAHAVQPAQVARVVAAKIPFDDLTTVPDAAWATPVGVAAENVALFALIDVLQNLSGAADPHLVRIGAILVRKPALALAFMNDVQKREWMRVIGQEAQPVPANVIQISQFQQSNTDYAWGDAISRVKASGGVIESSGLWLRGSQLPTASGQEWISGRAAVAVHLLSKVTAVQAEQKLLIFVRSVEDGTAAQAVS